MRLALLFISLVVMIGCSVAKDSKTNSQANTRLLMSDRKMSSVQINIIAAVRRSEVSALLQELERARPADLDFLGLPETPMQEALKLGSLEVIKILLDRNVDPFNLGMDQQSLQRSFISNRSVDVLEKLKFQKLPNRPSWNAGEAFFFEKLGEIFRNIVSQASNNVAVASSLMKKTKLSCDFLTEGLIQEAQLGEAKDGSVALQLLKQQKCEKTLTAAGARALYEIELKRQFVGKFADPALMVYIAGLKNLGTTMYNIDRSGIWVSPTLLYRIAHEPFDAFCQYAKLAGASCPVDNSNNFKESELFMENVGMPKEEFEVIHLKAGRVVGSYRLFPKQEVLGREDSFFLKVSAYMRGTITGAYEENESGEREFVARDINWDVGVQRSRRMYSASEEHDFAWGIDQEVEVYMSSRGYKKGEDGRYLIPGKVSVIPHLPPPPPLDLEPEEPRRRAEDDSVDEDSGGGVIDDLPMPP